MTLKEYIEILQTFDPNVEVLKKTRCNRSFTALTELRKFEIIPPHQHYKRDLKTGRETLVDSFVV